MHELGFVILRKNYLTISLPDFDAVVKADNFELLGEAFTLEAATLNQFKSFLDFTTRAHRTNHIPSQMCH